MDLSFLKFAVPIVLAVIFIVLTIRRALQMRQIVPPNELAVITGRKYKRQVMDPVTNQPKTVELGARFVSGAGTFVLPILEEMKKLSLNVMQVDPVVNDVPDVDGVLVTVKVNANVKIKSDEQSAPLAAERFLGMSEEQIREIAKTTMQGNLRAVVGRLSAEALRKDTATFMQHVLDEAGKALAAMGLGIDSAQIEAITDGRKYFESIGLKKTAEVVRDATVGQAEATRDADRLSAEARRIGETAKAESEKSISDAQRIRDMAIADNQAQVRAQQAQIPIAADIAEANRTAELNIAKVGAQKAQANAEIELQEVAGKRNAAEYNATIVVKADKEREATVIGADARRQAAELDGEAFRLKAEKEGQGAKARQSGEAEGRIALAGANQRELEASAAGEKAGLLAKAAGRQADLEATAAGELAMAGAKKAMLLAEAEGASAKAKAFKELDEAGRFLMILQALPPVIDALGIAVERSAKPFAEAIGKGLGNIDEVRIVNLGAGQAGGQNLLTQFANTPVEALYGMIQKLKSTDLWPTIVGLAGQAGIDVGKLEESVNPTASKSSAPSEEQHSEHGTE